MATEAVFEDEQFKKFLSQLDKNLSKVENGKKEFGALVASIVYADVIDHFEKEEGPKGPWKAWSATYKKMLEKIGRAGNKKLQYSGHLRQNFKPTNFRSIQNGLSWFNNAKTKTGFPFAFAHDEGGQTLPQREFMWLSEDAAEKMAKVTLQFILEKGI